jgi:hypothetical protein
MVVTSNPIELTWKELVIKARIKKSVMVGGKKKNITEEKIILNNLNGTLRPG